MQAELVAPISVDLRAEDLSFDIIKGLEHLQYMDGKQDDLSASFSAGDWVIKTATGFAVVPAGNGPAGVYPVIVGNNQYDAQASGHLTVAVGSGFLVKTNKFVAGSYVINQNLTVKSNGLQGAGGSDAIIARIYDYDSVKGVMTILVLNR